MSHTTFSALGYVIAMAVSTFGATQPVRPVSIGVAKVDITPELPIRLSGYQSRPTEATRAETRLYARALAIGSNREKAAVLITVELIGVGEQTRDKVASV